jgi:hypothetical protein
MATAAARSLQVGHWRPPNNISGHGTETGPAFFLDLSLTRTIPPIDNILFPWSIHPDADV